MRAAWLLWILLLLSVPAAAQGPVYVHFDADEVRIEGPTTWQTGQSHDVILLNGDTGDHDVELVEEGAAGPNVIGQWTLPGNSAAGTLAPDLTRAEATRFTFADRTTGHEASIDIAAQQENPCPEVRPTELRILMDASGFDMPDVTRFSHCQMVVLTFVNTVLTDRTIRWRQVDQPSESTLTFVVPAANITNAVVEPATFSPGAIQAPGGHAFVFNDTWAGHNIVLEFREPAGPAINPFASIARWFQPAVLPWLLSTLVAAGLAVLLLKVDPEKDIHQAFAIFLMADAAMNFGLAMRAVAGEVLGPRLAWYGAAGHIATTFAGVHFLFKIREKRMALEKRRALGRPFIAASVVLVVATIIWPKLWTVRLGAEDHFGPLFLFSGVIYLGYALLSLLLAIEYTQHKPGARQRSLIVASLGFSFLPSFVATSHVTYLLLDVTGIPLNAWATGAFLITISAMLPLLILLGLLVRIHLTTPDPEIKSDMLRFVLALVTPWIAVAAVLMIRQAYGIQAFINWNIAFEGIWTVLHLGFVVYALLRHRLFDLDIKLKWTVKQGTIVSVFASVFFLASEVLEQFIPVDGPLLGVAAAGIVALALRPIQKMAQNVATRVMPGVVPLEELGEKESMNLYEEQLDLAWEDGKLGEKEKHILENLQRRLGLSADDVSAIEARRERRMDAAGTTAGA